ILIGEVGWPSAGRMRRGALPSPSDQAQVLTDVLTRGKQEHFRANLIEAFDQPWKRALEGTVGGHWGLFDDAKRARKFTWGEPVSNHPQWPWQAAGGVILAAAVFAAAGAGRRRRGAAEKDAPGAWQWAAVTLSAVVAGVLIGWTFEAVPVESLGFGGWLRSLAFATLAVAIPIAGAAALTRPTATPTFAQLLGPREGRTRDPMAQVLGVLLIALTVVAVQAALALSFDPRYRDFPFAPLTAAALPFVLIGSKASYPAPRPLAERLSGVVLVLCAAFVVWNETLANWQALWFAGALGLLAFSLLRARAAPG
ncbi:MAG: beta-(1-6) glucans synthase, partial [Rhizobiales bacterium]|nr:beta-(1-6) glucans synthase [Hyphomicrobiales bacterium]